MWRHGSLRPLGRHVVMIPLALSAPSVRSTRGGRRTRRAGRQATRPLRTPPQNVVSALPHCHRSVFYDNSTNDGPNEVASFRYGFADYPSRWPTWIPEPLLEL